MEICKHRKIEAQESYLRIYGLADRFDQFLQTLPQTALNGYSSDSGHKFLHKSHPLTHLEAKDIYINLVAKQPTRLKKNWKSEEVALLLYLVDKVCFQLQCEYSDLPMDAWNKIESLLECRTAESCRAKVFSLVPSNLNERPWTKKEQDILNEVIE